MEFCVAYDNTMCASPSHDPPTQKNSQYYLQEVLLN